MSVSASDEQTVPGSTQSFVVAVVVFTAVQVEPAVQARTSTSEVVVAVHVALFAHGSIVDLTVLVAVQVVSSPRQSATVDVAFALAVQSASVVQPATRVPVWGSKEAIAETTSTDEEHVVPSPLQFETSASASVVDVQSAPVAQMLADIAFDTALQAAPKLQSSARVSDVAIASQVASSTQVLVAFATEVAVHEAATATSSQLPASDSASA
jgi:hypothetical protein